MKKQLLLLTVIFSLLMSNVLAQTVYITKTGKKYHIESCRYLRSSSFAISLQDALSRGYDACSICAPPTSSSQSTRQVPTNLKNENTNSKLRLSSQTVQCSAITKKGTQCSRMTKSLNGKCWQHGGS